MAFLETILVGANNAKNSIEWNNFQYLPKEKIAELVPSVILRTKKGEDVIYQYDTESRIKGYINNNGSFIKATNLTVTRSLGRYGLYDINLEGEIFNLDHASVQDLSKLLIIGTSYDLFYGYGSKINTSNKKLNSSDYRWIPCKLSAMKIKRVDYKRYSFDLKLYNDIFIAETELNLSEMCIKFNEDDFEIDQYNYERAVKYYKIKASKQKLEATLSSYETYYSNFDKYKFTTFKMICSKIAEKMDILINMKDKSQLKKIKDIEFQYGLLHKSTSPSLYKEGNPDIGNLKIYKNSIQMNPFQGNIKTTLLNITKLLPDEIKDRINFVFDETDNKTIITFYDTETEFGNDSTSTKPIEIVLNNKNSLIKNIDFDYQKPLYSLALLKIIKESKTVVSKPNEQIFRKICEQIGFNFETMKQFADCTNQQQQFESFINIVGSYYKEQESKEANSSNVNKQSGNDKEASTLNIGSTIVQFFGITCSLDTKGFTGFFPGQKFIIKNDPLFDGEYFCSTVTDTINKGGFDTKVDLYMTNPSNNLVRILGMSPDNVKNAVENIVVSEYGYGGHQ